MSRWAVRAFAGVLLLAVVAPPLRDPPADSFPLSTYPMFSHPRATVAPLQLALAVESDGSTRRLPPQVVSGSSEIIHAASTLLRAVNRGDAEVLCLEIVARLADDDPAVAVELRTEEYDVVAWFDDDREPRSSTVNARCEVGS